MRQPAQTDALLELLQQTGINLSSLIHLPAVDRCTVRNCSSIQAYISLHSCACQPQTDALLETFPADRQTSLFTHAPACTDRCTVRTAPADRHKSLFTHALACRRQMHCQKLFQHTGIYLSSLMRLPVADRRTVRNFSSRHASIHLIHAPIFQRQMHC
jgi:hypothetical protein